MNKHQSPIEEPIYGTNQGFYPSNIYPAVKCPKCGNKMRLETKPYLVMPPRLEYTCLKCGLIRRSTGSAK